MYNTNSSINAWQCTSCNTTNNSNRERFPCCKCHILESQNNVKRAKALYILGNISKPSVCLIPLKTQFFIYPLDTPIVSHSISNRTDQGIIAVDFTIDIYDIKGIEKYHIEKVKFDVQNKESFVLHTVTPYYNIFSKEFNTQQYNGVYPIDIYVKCYGTNNISPKQTINLNLCHSMNNNNNTMVQNNIHIQNNIWSPNNNNNNSNNEIKDDVFIGTSTEDVDDIVFVKQKDFDSMTVKELKEECRKYRFYVTGAKKELILRLKYPLKYIEQRKFEYHQKKVGKGTMFFVDDYVWKHGKVTMKK